MNSHLHIVCFIIPYPPDYGGVFDLYNKIVALHSAGIHIHLHCFTEKVFENNLSDYCDEVFYYPRTTGLRGLSFNLPYIVSSRLSNTLVQRLNNDDHPVLIEGIHSTGFLLNKNLRHKKFALRLHNVEHVYYSLLAEATRSTFKRLYFSIESRLLRNHERSVAAKVDAIFAVSNSDAQLYRSSFNAQKIIVLPVFIDFEPAAPAGRGCFCLYHGNLSVPENEKAAMWLLFNVFSLTEIPFIIAGKKPSRFLKRLVSKHPNVSLVADPTNKMLDDLITKAQCHVLPSFNKTGIKLKLVHALYRGRFCIVNEAAVEGTGLESLCEQASNAVEFREKVTQCYNLDYTAEQAAVREQLLQSLFNQAQQVQTLIQWLS